MGQMSENNPAFMSFNTIVDIRIVLTDLTSPSVLVQDDPEINLHAFRTRRICLQGGVLSTMVEGSGR